MNMQPQEQKPFPPFVSDTERQANNFQKLLNFMETIGNVSDITELFSTISLLLNYDLLLNCLMTIAEEGKISGRGLAKKTEQPIGVIQRRLAEWSTKFNLVAKEEGKMGKWFIINDRLRMGLKRLASGIAYLRPS